MNRAPEMLPDPSFAALGQGMHDLASQLFPICRSITGNGVRQSLAIMQRHIALQIHEIPTGTQAFDWVIPQEWNIRRAHIKDAAGRTVADFAHSNLHVVGYSVPVARTMSLAELKPHLHALPEQPDLIPYRTAYWTPTWGFCLTHRALSAMPEGTYEVLIDSALTDGALTYGEYVHQGESDDEFLLTAHICHPSLANDNCSGLALLTLLAQHLSRCKTRLSYRFVFAPGTIGAITWLSRNEHQLGRIKHGLVVAGVGDGGKPSYKRSRRGDALIDQMAEHVFAGQSAASAISDFEPYGYDERQFCSPGFDLPVGLIQRSRFGTFPEYHTSADNLDFITPHHLADSFEQIWRIIQIAESNYIPLNLAPKGEAQLGRRGLYRNLGGDKGGPVSSMAMLWVLNQADGTNSLLDIARRAKLPFATIHAAARALSQVGLLAEAGGRRVKAPG
jgi:aminopeptidase-like protein